MKSRRIVVFAMFALLAGAAGAQAATVTLGVDAAASSVKALPVTSGGRAYVAPTSRFAFVATVRNDSGRPAVPSWGGSHAVVDLVARTASGDRIVSTRTITDALPVRFPLQALQQTTVYYARLRAEPAVGVAVATNSNRIRIRAVLRHLPRVSRSTLRPTVIFSGVFARPVGVRVDKALRVLIQRRAGRRWVTVARRTPIARTWHWRARVGFGVPSVFRVRTVPVRPVRYVPITEARYCVARTAAYARRLCRGVALGAN